MEFVGLMLILTFVAMLTTCGLAFPMQSPPPERHALRCPEDDAAASVIVSWDRTQQQVRIIGCDHQRMAEHGCLERCLPQLQVAFPARVPTTVIP